MLVYRCCSEEEVNAYIQGKYYIPKIKSFGSNTFSYNNHTVYLHFFLFPECIEIFKNNFPWKDYIIVCDIPEEILKDSKGYGFYLNFIEGFYTPLPEFSIPLHKWNLKYILEITKYYKKESKNIKDLKEYLKDLPDYVLANSKTGEFKDGYNKYSILEFKNQYFKS